MAGDEWWLDIIARNDVDLSSCEIQRTVILEAKWMPIIDVSERGVSLYKHYNWLEREGGDISFCLFLLRHVFFLLEFIMLLVFEVMVLHGR
jgi:hypothetical protein